MRERPILFSAPMVRAILEGKKTQTRRAVKPCHMATINGESIPIMPLCPYGPPGTKIWGRETCRAEELPDGLDGVRYLADGAFRAIENTQEAAEAWLNLCWYGKRSSLASPAKTVPAIHMPRWASRILLEIVSVSAERLQDISEADAMAEGVTAGTGDFDGCFFCGGAMSGTTAKVCYGRLWESINGHGSWDANPMVWVVSFKRVET